MLRQQVANWGLFLCVGILVAALLGGLLPIGSVQAEPLSGGTLDPLLVQKYETPLVIPPAMPRTDKIRVRGGKNIDYYEIAVRQFQQQILPAGFPMTTVWSYGSANHAGTFNYPAFTIEAKYETPVRVKWINDLVNPVTGSYLPHILPVDQTLHWANPPGGIAGRDMRGSDPSLYMGPIPIVTHVHGAHTHEESDGYTEAWYLPAAGNIPMGYATVGTFYDEFKAKAEARLGQPWEPGSAVFQYPNDQRATTLWYHDHSLGLTRVNVYAGPAGFYLLRGGPTDVNDGALPGPAPALDDPPGLQYYEIPIVVQDRSFNADGSLFYPDKRAFFEGVDCSKLRIPFIPEDAVYQQGPDRREPSDISPIWQPEFFGNTMVVNGSTWPALDVEPRRYRLRFLNGCNSRFLILKLVYGNPAVDNAVAATAALPFWQIGSEGGFLPAPVELDELLMSPAERADCIVDFTGLPEGTEVYLANIAPDEPFGGGIPGLDFDPADPETTGQVMKFVVTRLMRRDMSVDPASGLLELPMITPLGEEKRTRKLTLNEEESRTVFVSEDEQGNIVLDAHGERFAPAAALLGVLEGGDSVPLLWSDEITETPAAGDTEVWEIYNFTEDAHPIHVHLVMFEVVNRENSDGEVRSPESWETGWKDTVIAYPGEITRIKAKFDIPGLYVWHCHIVEHEDNEMMRPYRVLEAEAEPAILPLRAAIGGADRGGQLLLK